MWLFGKLVNGWVSPIKKTLLYLERDEKARATFINELKAIDDKSLVYLDESGVDRSLYRPYGRSPRGTVLYSEVSGKEKRRLTMIAALNDKSTSLL